MAQKTLRTELNDTGKAAITGGAAVTEISVKVPQAEKSGLAEHEKWLYENRDAMASVKRGLEDLAAGRTHKRRSYAEYADAPVED